MVPFCFPSFLFFLLSEINLVLLFVCWFWKLGGSLTGLSSLGRSWGVRCLRSRRLREMQRKPLLLCFWLPRVCLRSSWSPSSCWERNGHKLSSVTKERRISPVYNISYEPTEFMDFLGVYSMQTTISQVNSGNMV